MRVRAPSSQKRRLQTLIMVRRALTEPKIAFVGIEISFARPRVSIAAFKEKRRPSRASARPIHGVWWPSLRVVMAEGTVQSASHEGAEFQLSSNRDGRQLHYEMPRACAKPAILLRNLGAPVRQLSISRDCKVRE